MSAPTRKPLRTTVDRNGRIVLPAEARRALGVAAGDVLLVEIADGVVRLRTYADAASAARERVRAALKGKASSGLADELIAERRSGRLWNG